MSSLVGAWELVSDAEEGVIVFTDTHYSMVWQEKGRNAYSDDDVTDEAELAAYRTHQSQAGTYKLSGNTLIVGREICRHPGRAGIPADVELSFQGDMLTLRRGAEMTWRKVN